MQSLNDDMDELFRRAGEEYPLNTNAANWDKVMQKLHHAVEDLPEENKKKKDYRYLLLLLLLPIGFMIGRYMGNENKATVAETNKEVKAAPASSGKTQPTTPGAAITGIKAKEHSSKGSGTKEVKSKEVINNKVNNTAGNLHGSNTDKFASNNVEKKPVITTSKFNASLMKAGMPEKVRKNNENNLLSNMSSTRDSEDLKDGKNVTTGKIPSAVTDNGAFNSQQPSLQTDTSTVADTNKKNNITSEQNAVPVASKESKDRKPKTFKPKFSYSFVIGPDLSIVKLQRTSNAGYSVGLMLGYQVSSKMTVEGGALWDRKNYYTNGEYMDTSRLKLPMHSVVLSANGYCNMIEIPVNIRYELITKQNHSWFISAGLSSYLMKKEEYDLSYTRYNQPYATGYSYKNSSKDWFSIMNVSAGYQRTLGKFANIRFAPYVKLPLRGVGIGKLPISSTGIYLSISRSVH